MPTISRENAEIYYQVEGDGYPVVLVNGYMRPSNDFRALCNYLVSQGFQTILIDNRGAGKSTASAPFQIEDMAEDVKLILDELGIGKVYVVGISMGGMIAQVLAVESPDLVERLILVSTCPDISFNKPSGLNFEDDEKSIAKSLSQYVSERYFAANEMLIVAMAKQMKKNFQTNPSYNQYATWQRSATQQFKFTSQLDKITCPTLVIHGEEDKIILKEAAEELLAHIKNASYQCVQGAGHLLLAEDLGALKKMIVDFLRE